MPKAKPIPFRPKEPKELEEIYMRDLERAFPDKDGRTLRGLAKRLSKAKDFIEQDDMLEAELGVPRRYERTPAGEIRAVEKPRRRNRERVERNPVPAQGEN